MLFVVIHQQNGTNFPMADNFFKQPRRPLSARMHLNSSRPSATVRLWLIFQLGRLAVSSSFSAYGTCVLRVTKYLSAPAVVKVQPVGAFAPRFVGISPFKNSVRNPFLNQVGFVKRSGGRLGVAMSWDCQSRAVVNPPLHEEV